MFRIWIEYLHSPNNWIFWWNLYNEQVGGVEEYEVCQALADGSLNKPIVAWCIGTCAGMFNSEVQFGHAGACANSDRETAMAKNRALREAGAHVPVTFDELGNTIMWVMFTVLALFKMKGFLLYRILESWFSHLSLIFCFTAVAVK